MAEDARPEAPLEDQRALYDAFIEYGKLRPWTWMLDSDLFGVRDPEGGETAYCCVLGNLGETLGLVAYTGPAGLRAYLETLRQELPEDPVGALMLQHGLMASFEDREMLDKTDRDDLRALGLKFRGRQAWPQFRSYLPGYYPWYLTAEEVRLMTLVVRQAMDVARRYRDDPSLLQGRDLGEVLVRVLDPRSGEWRDEWESLDLFAEPEYEVPPLNREMAEGLQGYPRSRQVLEAGTLILPVPVSESRSERPWLPGLALVMDHKSGLVLAQEMVPPDEMPAAPAKVLASAIGLVRELPKEVQVSQPEVAAALGPFALALGIKLKTVGRLTALSTFRREMEDLAGGPFRR